MILGLFFDYEKGKLGVFELMDVKQYAANILGRKADSRRVTACIRPRGSKLKKPPYACSRLRLVAARSLIPRLTDIIEARTHSFRVGAYGSQ
jgi:hypothetical protein